MFQCSACIVKCVRQPQYKYKNQIGKLWAEQKKKARAQNEEEKIVALLTACMLMTGMFTGCGSSQQAAGSSGAEAGQTQTGDNSLFNEPGQLPIVNEPVTLTVFAPANPDGSWEDNEW